jgi:hypothetical protein
MPDRAFWNRSVGRIAFTDIDPVGSVRFTLSRSLRIATAGSCFAQHLSAEIDKRGFTYFVAEPAPRVVPQALARKYSYGVFSARYGNIYTARQLLQLLHRAYGIFAPAEPFWQEADFWVDPFRPTVQPSGFGSLREAQLDRDTHLAAVRHMTEKSDVFIFTLGLTEAWESQEDGAVFPICPGCAWGEFSAERYRFRNFTLDEIVDDMGEALEFMRARQPNLRVILTVSPVPLVATAEPRHVLTSTIYSKSLLRVAAQQLMEKFSFVDYFPSYEIISGPATAGHYYSEDKRNIRPEGVRHVMAVFARHYLAAKEADNQNFLRIDDKESGNRNVASSSLRPTTLAVEAHQDSNIVDVICDEMVLDQDTAKISMSGS